MFTKQKGANNMTSIEVFFITFKHDFCPLTWETYKVLFDKAEAERESKIKNVIITNLFYI